MMVVRLIKWIFILIAFFAVAVLGYAIFGDLSAPTREINKEFTIDVD